MHFALFLCVCVGAVSLYAVVVMVVVLALIGFYAYKASFLLFLFASHHPIWFFDVVSMI